MTEVVVGVEHLSKRFESVLAVDAVDFVVERGSTTALLGGNGAGKTTTLAMILGLLLPSAGRITIFGQPMPQRRYPLLTRMNFSSPYMDLPHRLTVRENLTVYAHLYGLSSYKARIQHLAQELDLEDLLHRIYGKLSSGQKTRVALAKALLNEPELLLLDEPTASLDPDTADYVRSYLEGYQKSVGATVLLASHNMSEVERLCDNVIMLRAGKIVDQGTPLALLERYGRQNMEEVFIDIARERHIELALPQRKAAR